MLSIVVVEDNDDLRAALVGTLAEAGHSVVGLDCAEAVIESNTVAIDLMVLDINLPGEDGLSFARRIRQTQPEIGVVMVTGRGRLSDRKTGYDSGADIYLTKPVEFEELHAAIGALSRRIRPKAVEQDGLSADLRALTLSGPEGTQSLSALEGAMLAAFARAPDFRLESWQLVELFGASDGATTRNALNVTLSRLVAKLRKVGSAERPIRSIRNWGYRLCVRISLR